MPGPMSQEQTRGLETPSVGMFKGSPMAGVVVKSAQELASQLMCVSSGGTTSTGITFPQQSASPGDNTPPYPPSRSKTAAATVPAAPAALEPLPPPDLDEGPEAHAEYENYLARWAAGTTLEQRWARLEASGKAVEIREAWEDHQLDMMLHIHCSNYQQATAAAAAAAAADGVQHHARQTTKGARRSRAQMEAAADTEGQGAAGAADGRKVRMRQAPKSFRDFQVEMPAHRKGSSSSSPTDSPRHDLAAAQHEVAAVAGAVQGGRSGVRDSTSGDTVCATDGSGESDLDRPSSSSGCGTLGKLQARSQRAPTLAAAQQKQQQQQQQPRQCPGDEAAPGSQAVHGPQQLLEASGVQAVLHDSSLSQKAQELSDTVAALIGSDTRMYQGFLKVGAQYRGDPVRFLRYMEQVVVQLKRRGRQPQQQC